MTQPKCKVAKRSLRTRTSLFQMLNIESLATLRPQRKKDSGEGAGKRKMCKLVTESSYAHKERWQQRSRTEVLAMSKATKTKHR